MKCACGCGRPVTNGKQFIRGHWSRTREAKAMFAARRSEGIPVNPQGLCLCGCGQPTSIAKVTDTARGRIAGQPMRYLPGHAARGRRGALAGRWKGGRYIHRSGYVYVHVPDHPSANRDGYVFEHRLVMEVALGRFLLSEERVHHRNRDKGDNRIENLELFASQGEHMRLHATETFADFYRQHPELRRLHGLMGAASRWRTPPGR